MQLRLRRPSAALVVASAALVLSLGGTSYAVLRLPTNSVGSAQIRKNAVTGAKVRDHSLSAADLRLKTLTAVPGALHALRADTAANAAALGGRAPSAYVTSDRIVRSAGVDFNSPAGARLFLDRLTGADVRHFGIGEVQIVNTNAVDPLEVHGISERAGSSTSSGRTRRSPPAALRTSRRTRSSRPTST